MLARYIIPLNNKLNKISYHIYNFYIICLHGPQTDSSWPFMQLIWPSQKLEDDVQFLVTSPHQKSPGWEQHPNEGEFNVNKHDISKLIFIILYFYKLHSKT